MKMKRVIFSAVAMAIVGGTAVTGVSHSQSGMSNGQIVVPDNFRTEFEFLGAWAVAGDADTGGAVGQHIVYASPGTIAAFRKTGGFPDGTVLVKELFNGKTETLTTGEATSAADVAGYFVMVRDAAGKNNGPLWGDGWGWAFFKPDNKTQTVSTDYQADCLSCHEPVRDRDLVYSYAYPVLGQ